MAINERQVALRATAGAGYSHLNNFFDRILLSKTALNGVVHIAVATERVTSANIVDPLTDNGWTTNPLASGGYYVSDGHTALNQMATNFFVAPVDIVDLGAADASNIVMDDNGNLVLCDVVDSTTLDPVLINGKKVYGILQTAKANGAVYNMGDTDVQILFVIYDTFNSLDDVQLPPGDYAFNIVKAKTERKQGNSILVGGADSQTDVIQATSVEPLVHTLTVTASIAAATALGINTGNAHINTTVGGADVLTAPNISLGVDAAAFNANDDLMVFLNGIKLIKNSEVTWASAVTLTLSIALDTDDVIEIVVPV